VGECLNLTRIAC